MDSTKSRTSKRCTVLLRNEVYSRLRMKGQFGESFPTLIDRLLDEIDKKTEVAP